MARKYRYESDAPERTTILTFEGSFHGRSMAAISAAGSEKLTKGFGPLLPGFRNCPSATTTRCAPPPPSLTWARSGRTRAGRGRHPPAPDQCLKGLRDLCDEHGLLLIFDEIQCGMGRTGQALRP
jgi:acetylornithine/N-succinyldiaminopimelate aminotransferase